MGLLNPDGTVDKKRTSVLVELAKPLPVTFHRAFDMSVDYCKSLEDIIDVGCSRVLSSGGAPNVELGFNNLVHLLKLANNRIDLIPGSGVTIHNVKKFIDAGFKNIHLSAKMNIKSKMEYRANLSMTASPHISSFDYIGVDLQKLNQFVAMSVRMKTYSYFLFSSLFITSCLKQEYKKVEIPINNWEFREQGQDWFPA